MRWRSDFSLFKAWQGEVPILPRGSLVFTWKFYNFIKLDFLLCITVVSLSYKATPYAMR
jgi:hypothetical protein